MTTISVNTTRIWDNDGDTGVKSEPSADLDRLDLFAATSAGADNAIEVTGDDAVAASLNNPYIKVLKHVVLDTDVRIQDAVSGNTYIELTDTGAADIIKFVANGTAMLNMDGPLTELQAQQNLSFAATKGIVDLDGDTKIQLEASADEDIIRFDTEGVEALQIVGNVGVPYIYPQVDIKMRDSGATIAGKKIGDEDLDTYIQFNQATGGTDDDTIRMYAGGTEMVRVTNSSLTLVAAGADFGVGGNIGAGVTTFPTGGDKGISVAEGTRPTAANLNDDEVFITAVANAGYAGQSDLYIDFKDSASTKKTIILGEDCTFPNTINTALGTASLPAYTFAGDPNTGIYSPGADQVTVSTGGVNTLVLASSLSVLTATTITMTGAVGITGNTVITGTTRTTGGLRADAGIDTNSSGVYYKTKVIEIGDWNMDAVGNVNIAHGLTASKIRNVQVTIRNDTDTQYFNLGDTDGAGGSGSYSFYWGGTNISIFRTAAGLYDNVNYDSTSYNRGWITILYEA